MNHQEKLNKIKEHLDMIEYHKKEATRLVEELTKGDVSTSPSRKGSKLSQEAKDRLLSKYYKGRLTKRNI